MAQEQASQAPIPADYNDGLTAARRPVLLHLKAEGLALITPGAADPFALWDYASLKRLDEALPGAPLRLATDRSDGRLILRDGVLPPALATLAPQLARRRRRVSHRLAIGAIGLVAAIAALALVILAMPQAARLAVPLVPKSWEQALGRQLSGEVSALFAEAYGLPLTYCRAPAGLAALERLQQRLAAKARSPFDFTIRVQKLPMVNAMALPGGDIIIFSEFLDYAESPDEVAGVLAHEMTHVVRRHAMARLMESLGLTLVFGVMLGDLGSAGLAAGGQAITNMSYSRRVEAEADDGAAAILADSAIGTQGLAEFFSRISAPESGSDSGEEEGAITAERLMTYLSSHPDSAGRARRFAALAKPLAPALSAADWQALRNICAVTETP